ncbi:type I restriction endonuclease [Agrobacterium pusense]|uniref:type I restriction endonuclease n=1 Tax=Agrobacterium pusense TaxID=648995 RepID=UPI003FD03637
MGMHLDTLDGESDVEQKFIYPLLTDSYPDGLGIHPENVVTKKNIRRFIIGKGADQKSYFPDYIVVMGGFPICVIEAKEPGTDLTAAFREARLYAHELNGIYEREVNPVTIVLAVNDEEIWIGHPSSSQPQKKIRANDLTPHSEALGELQALLNENILRQCLAAIELKTKPSRRYRPKAMLGGAAISDEAMPRNSFGATLADDLRYVFQPESRDERARVVRKAYVNSGNRSRYLRPIDKIIRASVPASHSNARLIADLRKPKEVMSAFGKPRKDLEHQVMLVIGGVGSGKSTFVDHIEEVALDADLKAKTLWVHINMNNAPGSADEIYQWLRLEIINGAKNSHHETDFSELETLKALYSVEINAFNRGRGKLYSGEKYDEKLAEEIEKLEADIHKTAVCYCRYLGGEKGKLVIIVLDNCDKRTRDEQLLMFQAAQWLKTTFKSLVILPLREETYDHHQNEPPLDTALKDLVFRIEPPDFHEVLVKRVQMALDETSANQPKTFRYSLPNSMHVDYAATEQARYLTAIVASIFVNDRTVSRLLMGLAGRNIRRAFELFLEICNSGHIPESEIVRITTSSGNHSIPLHIIMRVLLRRNKRFFSSKDAYVKNIVQSEIFPFAAMGFSRVLILNWLKARISKLGPTKLDGYFRVADLVADLGKLGLEQDISLREIEFLIAANCVLTEDFRPEITIDTLIKISPAGVVHLDLLTDANYWAAISEEAAFESLPLAQRISERLANAEKQFSLQATIANAWECVGYFHKHLNRFTTNIGYLENLNEELIAFDKAKQSIEAFAAQTPLFPWLRAAEELTEGSLHNLVLARRTVSGFFVDFNTAVSGLLFHRDVASGVNLSIGDRVTVRVRSVEPLQRKVHLDFVSVEN